MANKQLINGKGHHGRRHQCDCPERSTECKGEGVMPP